MQLTSTTTTADGRLSRGMVYHGQIVMVNNARPRNEDARFLCYDNKGEWMTFDLNVFVPLGEFMLEGVPRHKDPIAHIS